MEALTELAYALDTFYFLVMGAFVMWMAAGFAMLEAGLVRAKNTAEILTKIELGENFFASAIASTKLVSPHPGIRVTRFRYRSYSTVHFNESGRSELNFTSE